jgi:hypothetical protein
MFPPNPVLAGVIAAAGIAQAAIVASREIPAFAEGTDNAPGGAALVGDGGGSELVYDPNRRSAFLTPSQPTLMNINKGSKVFTKDETERIMRGLTRGDSNSHIQQLLEKRKIGVDSRPDFDQRGLEKAFEKAVKKIPLTEHNYDKRGYSTYQRSAEKTKRYLNKKHGLKW